MTRLVSYHNDLRGLIGHIYFASSELGLADLSMAARVAIWPILLVMNDCFTQFMNVIR